MAGAAGSHNRERSGEYEYSPGYYAVFFYDPDRIKLELVHQPDDRDLVSVVQELTRRVAELEAGR